MSSLPLRWHVLGAGALGSLWSARLARAGQDRIVRPIVILKDETWSGLGRPSECKIHVDEQHRCENSTWSIDVYSQPLSATDPIRRLLPSVEAITVSFPVKDGYIFAKSFQGSSQQYKLDPSGLRVEWATLEHLIGKITTKAPDVCNALRGVINRLEHDAVVVLLCNGMGAYDELISDERFRNISYMLAVTTNGVYTTERFKCVHAGLGDTWVGKPTDSLISAADACSTVGSLQQLSGLPVKLDEHINRRIWEKLAINASINGITAIMNCRNGGIMKSAHGISLVTNLCSEVCQVMEASGVPPSTSVSSVLEVIEKTAANFSSMQQDVMLGRPTEIDYINGFVVKKGLLLGVPTPTNLAIVDLVKMKERLQS